MESEESKRDGEDFGVLLRTYRVRRTWTQSELAGHAKVSVRTISGLELGRARPRLATARMLADALGLDGPDRDGFLAAAHGNQPAEPTPDSTQEPVPAQLPTDIVDFTGRAEELATLDDALPGLGGGATVVVLTGTAGVGKTALAVRWAHRVAGRFDDGQLYVNLRGFGPGPPVRTIEVVAGFLAALGVPAARIPFKEEQATALYRSLMSGRRMLVVLDNAADADQVRPLMPSGRDSLVLVTSRHLLTGLIVSHGAQQLTVAPLSATDASDLVTAIVGASRTAAKPEAVTALADSCARLPLALRIAAANVRADRYRDIGDYVDELRHGDRLASLSVDGDPTASVRGTFDWSYARLSAPVQRLFRQLGMVPGPGISAEAAAALGGTGSAEASRGLRALADAHLLEALPGQRYTFHDLLRAYATERGLAVDSPAEREAALRRLLDWYLRSATAAVELLFPTGLRLPLPESPAEVEAVAPTDRAEALSWLTTERRNLVAAVTHAADIGMYEPAWRLGDALNGYFDHAGYPVDWLAVGLAARTAAESDGDLAARSAAAINLAHAYHNGGDVDAAIPHGLDARSLAARAGWTAGEARALNRLAVLYADGGSLDRAAVLFAEALELDRRTGDRAGEAKRLMNLGLCAMLSGHLPDAAGYLREALDMPGAATWRYATALPNLGVVQRLMGDFDAAADTFGQALAASNQDGTDLPFNHTEYAELCLDRGRFDEAREHADAAETIARDSGERRSQVWALKTQAVIELRQGCPAEAAERFERLLDIIGDQGFFTQRVIALVGLADARRRLGRLEAAVAHAEEALALSRAKGHRIHEGEALTALADIHLDRHRAADPAALDQALAHAERALELQRRTGHRLGEARTLIVLAHITGHAGRDEDAARIRDEAVALCDHIGLPEAEARLS
ncbi:ATP-binding protein [Stackebrandtia nassauensis]|uniref:Transcriptional regulator, XRE family n=1 Tax=Stackebrandtia nassauensis (strain DSM 44728 / CIP 108903 / NRRL B-16338 / NBRC 102104 / LLR-40K-21) TaxID=446470 RepID=D3Q9E7_STANL|nr:tetratricopeptide repeat protein [Stackebrandtia nassauensis]ADD42629.1 transcriptional regulator, XRE family [Stackebrandtia nassauensis DSM 44728]